MPQMRRPESRRDSRESTSTPEPAHGGSASVRKVSKALPEPSNVTVAMQSLSGMVRVAYLFSFSKKL